MNLGDVHYGPGASVAHVPPEVLASKPSYIDYVLSAIDQPTANGEYLCMLSGTCCMDMENQRAGSWKSCPGGCENGARPDLEVGREARTDVEGCCFWGRGAIQTTGVCNFGKLNYFMGKKAADRGQPALFPDVDFCTDPGAICGSEHPELRWIAGFFYWLNDVQEYDVRGAAYIDTLHAWVDSGADLSDVSLVDMASGIVNRGCHDAPLEGIGGFDPCGNGEVHAWDNRRKNFAAIWSVLKEAIPEGFEAEAAAAMKDEAALRQPMRVRGEVERTVLTTDDEPESTRGFVISPVALIVVSVCGISLFLLGLLTGMYKMKPAINSKVVKAAGINSVATTKSSIEETMSGPAMSVVSSTSANEAYGHPVLVKRSSKTHSQGSAYDAIQMNGQDGLESSV